MMLLSNRTRRIVVGLIAALLSPFIANADTPGGVDVTPSVATALQAELDGDNDARQELLNQLLRTSQDESPARWQLGLVREQGDNWTDFREIPAVRTDLLVKYRRLRSQSGTDPEDLMRLADWCRDNQLPDAERAHLRQVLAQDSDHATARQRLGHFNLNGLWVTSEDFARAAARQAEIAASLQQWGETIDEGLRLLSGSRRQRVRGREQLFAIRDLSAIPAMERVLAPGNEGSGLLLIEWLSRLNAYQASQSIARTALVSTHDGVHYAAAESLRSRPFDEFMPILMGALKTPVTAQSRTYINPQGWVVLDMLFDSETQDERRQFRWSAEVGTQVVFRRLTGDRKGPDFGDQYAAKRYLLQRERQADQARLQWNELIRRTNQRSETMLRAVTEVHEADGPEDWWDWWVSFNELHVAHIKPTLRVQPDPERVYIQDRDKQLTDRRPRARWEGQPDIGQGSCLVAGTPVWTEQGLTSVEQVEIGDRVLAQDVNTGELAYKPVLLTTVRPPIGTYVISTDGIQLRATGGHPFWVNGEAWKFARDLEPGMRLHGTHGSQRINAVELADTAEAFNLVVADFHTYFLGEGQILSHDNTAREPTNSLVPGLSREPRVRTSPSCKN